MRESDQCGSVAEASWQVSARLRSIRSLLLANVVEEKLRKLERAVKANFDPNQPRLPRGNPDGGQWTGTGGSSGRTRLAQMPRGGRRIGSDAEGTPEQEGRLVAEEVQAQEAIRRVQEIDPHWKPQESLTDPNSIEGQIATARGQREEAEDRLITEAVARRQPAENRQSRHDRLFLGVNSQRPKVLLSRSPRRRAT